MSAYILVGLGLAVLAWVTLLKAGAAQARISINVSGTGAPSVTSTNVYNANYNVVSNPTVLIGQPASLTTRTSGTAGSLTMTNTGHGIVTGQRVDLYWNGGQCYGATVGTVSGTTVPITNVNGGSALPTMGTAITVGPTASTPFNVVGNNMQTLYSFAPNGGYIVYNNGTTDVYASYLGAGEVDCWQPTDVRANPLATFTTTIVYMSTPYTVGNVVGQLAVAFTN
jgi:hypothetical protein